MRPIAWRFAVLGGVACGLAVSSVAPAGAGDHAAPLLAAALIAGGSLVLARASRCGAVWLALVALAAATAGLAVGAMRLDAIDGGAFHGPIGREATARGFVTAVPHRANGDVSVRVRTADGRLA